MARYTPAHNDAEVCQLAKSASVSQLRHVLSRYVHHVDVPPDSAADEVVGDRRDHLVSNFDDDGHYSLHVSAPAEQGAIIDQALREAHDALFRGGQPDVTWLDALVEICHRSLDTVTNAARRDRYRVYLHLDTGDNPDDPDGAGGAARAWLNSGPQLPTSLRDMLLCDAVIRPLWHSNGLPINVGRAHYIVPAHTRRTILDRDRTCRHPTCTASAHLQIHHIHEWIQGGMTDTDNLVALCSKHHHAYHRNEFSMAGNPNIAGQLRFYDARGRPIPNTATPHPPHGPPPQPASTYAHPTGEQFNTLWFNLTPA